MPTSLFPTRHWAVRLSGFSLWVPPPTQRIEVQMRRGAPLDTRDHQSMCWSKSFQTAGYAYILVALGIGILAPLCIQQGFGRGKAMKPICAVICCRRLLHLSGLLCCIPLVTGLHAAHLCIISKIKLLPWSPLCIACPTLPPSNSG